MVITSNQISPGMVLSIDDQIYYVESSTEVTVPKGVPFIKTKLKNLISEEVMEKNFHLGQEVEEVALKEKPLEFLYLEGKNYLFLELEELDEILVPASTVGDKINYLKEGIQVKALFYGNTVFSVELPQFLELVVIKLEDLQSKISVSNASKIAIVETGAKVEVPLFIDVGDVVKIDTHIGEYVQRI